jgi:polar amino acid transport system ATP-binding protein
MSAAAVVRVRGLHTRLGTQDVLCGIDLDVRPGEVVAVIGASGSGKSTLLRALNYLTPFTAGDVEVAGHHLRAGMCERRDAEALRAVRRRVGMVFQAFHLFPHLSALANVAEAPRHVLGLDAGAARARAEALLARVGLATHAHAMPHTLSGGQQQRVESARALATEHTCLLFDEPTPTLDPRLTGEVLEVVGEVAAAGQTMVIVTHEMGFARRVAHRVVVLAGGRIVESGPPADVLERPRAVETRALLGLG